MDGDAGTDLAFFERLVRIETKLDLAHHSEATREKLEDQRHEDHETRIRRVERWMWLATGVAAAGGGAAGQLVASLLGN